MGKDWDKAVPPVSVWKDCLRVLKDGAFAFVMSIPRLDCWGEMARRLQEAGFEVGFTPIFWTYASGFPKSTNISKAIDKRLGVRRKIVGISEEYRRKKGAEIRRGIDNTSKCYQRGGRTITEAGYRNPKSGMYITAPATEEAKELDGSYAGFQPKPAIEVIIVAMKPLSKKTFVDQALANRKGIVWLDDCRIPYKKLDLEKTRRFFMSERKHIGEDWKTPRDTVFEMGMDENASVFNRRGRFPANLLVSDKILDDGKIRKASPVGFSGVGWKHSGNVKEEMTELEWQNAYCDSGGFSRYFSLDAWWTERVKELPEAAQRTFPFLIVPKASKREKDRGLEEFDEIPTTYGSGGGGMPSSNINPEKTKLRNIHPTVKPVALMSYLITLGSHPGNFVLDPYVGTATTVIAARLMRRDAIGFEINKEYYEIAKARLQYHMRQRRMEDWTGNQ